MCAIEAGKRGKTVLLIDHAEKPAEKIRISGGGRCNFTNLHTTPKNFISQNPHFCVSALSRYTPRDFIALVERHHIAYHEKTLGQLFCDSSSKQIIDMLLAECNAANVTLSLNHTVTNVTKREDGFSLSTSKGAYSCTSLVIATGGKSIPKMGATGFGYEIAEQFGLNLITPEAALVPFTLSGELLEFSSSLSGVSVNATATCNKTSFTEGLLFTHRGLSGPCILQISSYWKEGTEVRIDLAASVDVFTKLKEEKKSHPKQEPVTVLSHILPRRVAERICTDHHITGNLADISDKKLQLLADAVNNWCIIPSGTEGFRTAEVTRGGVDTKHLSSQSMECTTVPRLYFIGEVVDVTGHLGGFNFQWAWASGHAAGQSLR